MLLAKTISILIAWYALSGTRKGVSATRQVGYSYIGCYVDATDGVRDLNGLLGISVWSGYTISAYYAQVHGTSMTYRYCSQVCSLGGFAYMGLQNGNACYCGNKYGSQGLGTGCSKSCLGDTSIFCGGLDRNSVFALTYLDNHSFVQAPRSPVAIETGYSYPDPFYQTVQAPSSIVCAGKCTGNNCQAVIYSRLERQCHLLRFSLVPSDLASVAGVFFVRR